MPNAGAITEAGKLQADGSIAGAITPALECALSVAKGEENSGQSQAELNVCVLPQQLLTQRKAFPDATGWVREASTPVHPPCFHWCTGRLPHYSPRTAPAFHILSHRLPPSLPAHISLSCRPLLRLSSTTHSPHPLPTKVQLANQPYTPQTLSQHSQTPPPCRYVPFEL